MRTTARLLTLVAALGMFLVLGGLTGCQTVKGIGQDIENAGEAGERAIN